MGLVQFAAIYKTTILPPQCLTVQVPEIDISVFRGSREFRVLQRSFRIGHERDRASDQFFRQLKFRTSRRATYIVIAASIDVDDQSVLTAVDRGNALIDGAVAVLSALYTTNIFDIEIFRGPLNGEQALFRMITKYLPDYPPIQSPDVVAGFGALRRPQAPTKDTKERARRIGSLLSKYIASTSAYESFYFLWTALEVYPMANDSNVKRVIEMVARLTGWNTEKVNGLGLGRLHGYRARVTHDGHLPLDPVSFGRTLGNLEVLVRAALRELMGLDYDGSLDQLTPEPS